MAWSYRKRIKIIPGIHLNFSKRGISTSIGVKGASLNISSSGTYLNTKIPVLDVYCRTKLSGNNRNTFPKNNMPSQVHLPITHNNIFSLDVQEITSQNMQGVKEAMIMASKQRNELRSDLLKINLDLKKSKFKLKMSYFLLYGLLKKSIAEDIKEDIKEQGEVITQLQEHIENSYVDLNINFEPEISEKYYKLGSAFNRLATSNKIWDVTSAKYEDRAITRSSASIMVTKKEVKIGLRSIPDFKSKFKAFYFQNANGADLYFYPNFIIMYSSRTSFALIGYNEIELDQRAVRFTESGQVPVDSMIIDNTWAKVNRDGSPDRRFTGNYRIPVVKYAEITLRTNSGLNEEYEFSNYEYAEAFSDAFKEYQNAINALDQL
ncbi:DUF4236 domain-containing protein [Flavobacterium sp. '19STA2R22 D10 B1']|uniref:DUF4236 domain-containing protein n=1 Tax=Flavobacterium aerium TaxID=3037261 RepID=UPI00278C34A4|nr:DUF4236 domain-containing protein [Flavobacterium sp. '19STA2R22 D10 B1']